MNLLVTGASGFVGRNFLMRAPAGYRSIVALYGKDAGFPGFAASCNDPRIIAAQCDLADPAAVSALFDRFGSEWDACLYLSAKVDIPWSVRQPKQDLSANTGALLNVLERIRAKRLIYFSSGAVYDGFSGETTPDLPVQPTLPYAISKLASERYVEFYRARRGSIGESLIVRFFGAYGPWEAPHKIYTRLVRAFANSNEYTMYGDGKNLIDAMYVHDAVEAVNCMLTGDHWNRTVNLAGGNPVPVETLVRDVAAALGVNDVRIHKEGIANESNQFWGSTSEMIRLYGFTPQTTLPEGIDQLKRFLEQQHASTAGGRA